MTTTVWPALKIDALCLGADSTAGTYITLYLSYTFIITLMHAIIYNIRTLYIAHWMKYTVIITHYYNLSIKFCVVFIISASLLLCLYILYGAVILVN